MSTLLLSQDLVGESDMDASPGILFQAAFIHITAVGSSREMDLSAPSRIFRFGFFTLGQVGDATWDFFGNIAWGAPRFIDWENMVYPDPAALPAGAEYFFTNLAWKMNPGCEANISFWHI